MQKTNKSLLIKVLTVLCALCFTLVLAFGLVGCAKEQVAIVSADLVNSKLVLTYSDGSSKEYEIGKDGEDYVGLTEKCTDGTAHDFSSIVVKYANCKEKGIQLVVCSTCKGFKAVETEKNPELHGTYITELQQAGDLQVPVLKFVSYEVAAGENEEPTCTKEGKRITECAGCGEALANETIPALNHKHENGADAYVYVEGEVLDGNVCMDGTFDGYVCVLCNDIKDAVYDEPVGHHTADATWEVITAPTKDTVGKITGICTVCKEETEIELPKLTNAVYTHYVPTCQTVDTENQEVYTLTDYYGFSTEFKFNYRILHRIVVNSQDVLFFAFNPNATDNVSYEYTKLGLTADDFSGGKLPDCSTTAIAKVTCADCNAFISVLATGEHKYAAEPDKDAEGNVIKKAATCDETGYNAIYTCTAGCGHTMILPSDVTPSLGNKTC